jgi:ATP-binding cassette subfamily B protein
MSRITEDVSRVRMYTGPAIMYAINLIVLFVFVIATMISVNAELTLYVLIPLPILSISIYYVNSIINEKSEKIQQKLSALTTEAQQVYSGIRVVKSYVKEKMFLNLFEKDAEAYKQASLGLVKIESYFNPLMMLLVGLSTIITIYVGGIQVIKGEISPGNIAEFVMYVNMLTWPVTALGWIVSITQRAAASQKRINEFLDEPVDIESPEVDEFNLRGTIEFKNVSFTYPDTGIKALENVSFKIEEGKNMAILGRTGSGKTTIAELLLRMYDISSGEILIDGQDIRQLNLNSLRKQIGYVPQDVFLFSDSIEKNIAFSDAANITPENAAKSASVHNEILGFKEQYQTVVGERGITLSGGQKQRISIARAIIKNPSVIILDDCLSAVDTKTEKTILTNLKEVLNNKTSIVITHRISSMIDFDKVVVLDKGVVAEQGTHEDLMKLKGLYAEMYEKQHLDENILS